MRKLNYSTEIPDQLLDHFTFAAGSQSERIGLTLQQPPKLDATKIRLTAPTREPDSNEMGNNDHQPPLPTPLTARPIWSTGRAHPTEQQEQELQSKQQEWLLQHELPQLPARQTVTTHALSRQRTVRSGQTSVVNNAPQSQCWPKNRSHRAQSLDSRSKSTEITKYDYGTHYENVLELIATPSRIANSTSCCCTPVIQSNANLCKNPSVDHCDDCAVNNANAKCFNKFELTCKTVNKCNIIKNNLPVYHPLVDLPSSPSESSSGPNCAHLSSSTGASGSSSNQSVGRRRVQHTVRRIGVFYSDLCDVIRTMRPASSTISTITAATTNPHHHLASETHCIERSSFKRQKSRPNSCQEDGQHTMAKHSPIMQTSSGINQATLNHNETIDRNDSIDHHHHSVTTVEAAAIDTIDSAQSCALDSSSLFVFPTLIHSRGSIASSGLLPLATPNHHHHHQFHGPIAGSAQHYQHHLSHHLHHHHHPLPDLLHHPNLTPTTPATLSTHYISTASGASLPIDAHLMHHSHVLGGSTNRLSGANSMTPSNGTVAACSSASSGNHNALLPLPHLPRLAHCGSPSLPKPCLHCAHLGARWFVLLVALIGLLCALLGAYLLCSNTRPDQLPLALLMLGKPLITFSIYRTS